MKLIKARLHLHSKPSPGKLNYKSFIRQTSTVCILFHPSNVRLIFSPTICRHLKKAWGGGRFSQSHFSCPWQPMAFAKLSPLHLSSPRLHFAVPPSFFHSGSPAFIKPPPPFVTNTTALSMSNPLETAWGSQYGANRFSAFTVELLRQAGQTQLKPSRTTQNNCNLFFFFFKCFNPKQEHILTEKNI